MNSGDVDAFVELYSEEAVITRGPFGSYTGPDEIRDWVEAQIAVNAATDYEVVEVAGNTVTVESS